ncbi:Uncharacterised protein [Legionella busanensis]|uniref:Uncharacterized protein n=1 Tax=Legionella busanensis TaxID=190655 RepID=A0A378JMK7_9GAMM|nr:hypothetical protein [Legionella busanensis]STX52475.1 Uncharacterised protein [Legionella busanensis]
MKPQKDFTALKQEIQKALTDLAAKLSLQEQQLIKNDMAKPHMRHLTDDIIRLAKLYVIQHDNSKALYLLQVAKSSPLKDKKYHRLFGHSTCAMKIQAYEEEIKSSKSQTKTNVINVTSLPKPTPYRAPASSGNTSNMLRLMADAAYMQMLLTNQDNCPPDQTHSSDNILCHPEGHHHGYHSHPDNHVNNDPNTLLPFNVFETNTPTHGYHTHNPTVPEPSSHHPISTYDHAYQNDMNSQAHHAVYDTGSSYGHSSFFNDTSAHNNASYSHNDTSSYSHDTSSYNHDTSNSFSY